MRYVRHVMRGRVLTSLDRIDDAIAAFLAVAGSVNRSADNVPSMRSFTKVCAVLVLSAGALLAGGGRASARAAGGRQGTPGQLVESKAREMSEAVAASARDWLGNLHPAGQLAFRRWALAVGAWKKEKAPGVGALLAEGVLFDCLGRTLGLYTDFRSGMAVDPRFNDLGEPYRLQRAADLFEQAVTLDPNLLEARFRGMRIRAFDDAKAALDLERIARAYPDAEFGYLAAVSRAAIAQGRRDSPTAIRWYEVALELRPGSTAAEVGLSALTPSRPVQFETLEADDLYYGYPCRILTPSIASELARRIESVK